MSGEKRTLRLFGTRISSIFATGDHTQTEKMRLVAQKGSSGSLRPLNKPPLNLAQPHHPPQPQGPPQPQRQKGHAEEPPQPPPHRVRQASGQLHRQPHELPEVPLEHGELPDLPRKQDLQLEPARRHTRLTRKPPPELAETAPDAPEQPKREFAHASKPSEDLSDIIVSIENELSLMDTRPLLSPRALGDPTTPLVVKRAASPTPRVEDTYHTPRTSVHGLSKYVPPLLPSPLTDLVLLPDNFQCASTFAKTPAKAMLASPMPVANLSGIADESNSDIYSEQLALAAQHGPFSYGQPYAAPYEEPCAASAAGQGYSTDLLSYHTNTDQLAFFGTDQLAYFGSGSCVTALRNGLRVQTELSEPFADQPLAARVVSADLFADAPLTNEAHENSAVPANEIYSDSSAHMAPPSDIYDSPVPANDVYESSAIPSDVYADSSAVTSGYSESPAVPNDLYADGPANAGYESERAAYTDSAASGTFPVPGAFPGSPMASDAAKSAPRTSYSGTIDEEDIFDTPSAPRTVRSPRQLALLVTALMKKFHTRMLLTSSITSSGSNRHVNLATLKRSFSLRPGEGEVSSYVQLIRKNAGTAFNETGPGKWKLPTGIQPVDRKNKYLSQSTRFNRIAAHRPKKTSGVELKHGHLQPRLLAAEVDEVGDLNKYGTLGRSLTFQNRAFTPQTPTPSAAVSAVSRLNSIGRTSTITSRLTANDLESRRTKASTASSRRASIVSSAGSEGSISEYKVVDGYYQHPSYKFGELEEFDTDAFSPATNDATEVYELDDDKPRLVLANPDSSSDFD